MSVLPNVEKYASPLIKGTGLPNVKKYASRKEEIVIEIKERIPVGEIRGEERHGELQRIHGLQLQKGFFTKNVALNEQRISKFSHLPRPLGRLGLN